MKKITLLSLFCMVSVLCIGQVTTKPSIIQKGYSGPVTIIFNPNQGNKGMVGATACYAHTGVTVGTKKWQYANAKWRDGVAKYKMTKNKDGNWELSMPNGLYAFCGVSSADSAKVCEMAFVFNDGPSGSKEGKTADGGDIFVQLAEPGLVAQITTELTELSIQGDKVTLICNVSESANMSLTLNGTEVKTGTGTEMTYTGTMTTVGNSEFVLTATAGEKVATTTVTTYVCGVSAEEKRPSGIVSGIYYESNPTIATVCTFAAGCKNANDPSQLEHAKTVYVIGDFNNWKPSDAYQMKRDGNYFWLKLTGLTPSKEYAFQYLVVRADGKIRRISDLYANRVKESVSGAEGYASILQTNVTPYKWSDATKNFVRPDKNNLVIYELWVYDHTAQHNLKGLMKRMDYFSQLGVNCIELMPVNEFDNDVSWGYCPNHYFAVDKQYGQPNDLKAFVDSCHGRGIAVVLDMVLNHSTGNNPMNKLYPYGDDLKYNPWFNVSAPHPDNVYEDWNHDFAPTHQMMIDVLKFWMEEYKVDGYRLDLSHGLCGKQYNAYTNLVDYYEKAVKPLGGYMMLEHWGSKMDTERPNLVKAGMMCWANTCNAFFQTGMGWLKDGDGFENANADGYVSYPENHDEERTFFKVKMYGNGDLQTNEKARAGRVPLNLGFQCLLNGPQLFYHFTEVGFEIGKFQSSSGAFGKDGDNCAYGRTTCTNYDYKMSPKEAYKMTWTTDTAAHMQAMRDVGKIIRLRTRYMPEVFAGNPTESSIGSGYYTRYVRWGNDALVVGNFTATENQAYTLPAGTWYDYLGGNKRANSTYTLKPGQIKIFTGKLITAVEETKSENIVSDSAKKAIVNGKLYVVRDEKWYDVMGNKVR